MQTFDELENYNNRVKYHNKKIQKELNKKELERKEKLKLIDAEFEKTFPILKRDRNGKPCRTTLQNKYIKYKLRAESKKQSFTISYNEFETIISNSNCIYCGNKASTIDRLNSNIGYEIDNCAPSCLFCNLAKNKYSKDEFLNWIEKVYKYNFT